MNTFTMPSGVGPTYETMSTPMTKGKTRRHIQNISI
jgi:hypothetical protein